MPGEYTIGGGAADADRLARQARVMAEASEALLLRAGLTEGSACLDVGCGQGQVSIAMARVAGPSGRVVGTDVDHEALAAARSAAAQAGVRVDCIVADAAAPVGGPPFDLAYARLLLSHLVEPAAVVRAMRTAVRPGGAVAVEDLLTGTLRSEPARPVLDRLQSVYAATVRARGGDPTIGPRLPALLRANGLHDVAVQVVANPMASVDEKLFLVELVQNMRPAIMAAGAATEAEIDTIEEGTEEAARDPTTTFFQAEMYQVLGRRPLGESPGTE